MTTFGFALSSEEHTPNALVEQARLAEMAGFSFALISDHYHPWIDQQGQNPFVWSVLGGIAQATSQIRVGTGVTCPIIRIHPTIIAQAAATVAAMMPGRFFLGVGTGENLNEHIQGSHWPAHEVRQEMLEEAIAVIRLLWRGGMQSHRGRYYTVENARLYTLPEEATPLMIAASGSQAAKLAGQAGDGLISTAPEAEIVQAFQQTGGVGKPRYAQLTVCWAKDEASARETAYNIWPNAGLTGELSQELPTPAHFEQAAKLVREEDLARKVICGPDVQKYIEGIQTYIDAGFDHIYVHQVGPDQKGFLQFYKQQILPNF